MAKAVKITKDSVAKFVAENGFPEVGHFTEQKDLQKFYKHLSDAELLDWVTLEGLEFKPADSAPINRMRMAMAILYKNFPKEASAKKKSKYSDYTLERLVELAIENDVVFETTDDERILRMRAIMALRASKVIE
jgi:deoxyxylulose-5-phosphate synthase